MKTVLVGLNARFSHSALGLYSLAAYGRQCGQAMEVREYTINQELLHVLSDLAGKTPTVVGIACYIWNREFVLKLSDALKKVLPAVRIVLGGPEASGDAEAVLRDYPAVDCVIQGEGEESLVEWLQALAAAKEASVGNEPTELPEAATRIRGVAVRQDGRVERNGGARVVECLDRLPFPYAEMDWQRLENRIIYYESSRGCPFSCAYCVSAAVQGVRHRSLERVRQELQFFLDRQVRQVKFVDRTFNVAKAHYQGIWDYLAERPGVTGFHFEIVADLLHIKEVEWLGRLPVGLFQFEIGVQSTCAETLRAIGRTNRWEDLSQNVRALAAAGNIHLHLDLIVGLPYEGWAEFSASFNAVYGLGPDLLQIGFLKLLPGTPIRERLKQDHFVFLDHPPYEVLSNRYLSYARIRRLKQLEDVFEQTYNSGRFKNALAYLVECYDGDAFAFYLELYDWWELQGWFGQAHSPERVLEKVRRFADRLDSERQGWVEDLLKLDVLLEGGRSLRGEVLDWNGSRWESAKSQLWREESVLQRYCPGYRFTTWREVKRLYPLEVFSRPVASRLGGAADGVAGEGPQALLFDLTGERPHWHLLAMDEFPEEEPR